MAAPPPRITATLEALSVDPCDLTGPERVALLADTEDARAWIAARESALLATIHAERDDVDAGAKDTVQLSQRAANVEIGEAKRRALRATWTEELSALAEALESGRIGPALVDELCSLADRLRPERRPTLRAQISTLIDDVAPLTPRQARKHLVAWEAALDEEDGIDRGERQRRTNAFNLSQNPDGTHRISGQIDPVAADEFARAIDQRVAQLWRAESLNRQNAEVPSSILTNEARRLQALLDLVRAGAAAMPGVSSSANVIVVVDHQTLLGQLATAPVCRLTDGTPIEPAEARRLACDAGILPIVMGGSSRPLDVGRDARTATPAQRAALRVIHPTCGVHRCDVAFDHCEIHHISWWRLGGQTDLDNLIPLCSKHHHLVHDHRWDLVIDDERVARLVRRPETTTDAQPSTRSFEPPTAAGRPPTPRRNGHHERHPPDRVAARITGDHQVPMRC